MDKSFFQLTPNRHPPELRFGFTGSEKQDSPPPGITKAKTWILILGSPAYIEVERTSICASNFIRILPAGLAYSASKILLSPAS